MIRRLTALLACLATAGCSASAAGSSVKPTKRASSPLLPSAVTDAAPRIMPLGDSITDGMAVPGGYRTDLWHLLTAVGGTVHFVGSRSGGPAQLGELNHEGHPGWEIGQLTKNVTNWLRTYRPTTVLLQIGTNDMVRGDRISTAPNRLGTLIDRITRTAPAADVYVATITPLAARVREVRAEHFNAALSALVLSRRAANQHVHLVDMHSALTTADLSADGVHPTAVGYAKMAVRWYEALTGTPLLRWQAADPAIGTVNDGERLPSAGAIGGQKIGYLDNPDSYVELSITVPTTGRYRLFVRAANGMNTTCSQSLTVNGRAAGRLDYPAYGWEQWSIIGTRVSLTAGADRLRFGKLTCGIELDSVAVGADG